MVWVRKSVSEGLGLEGLGREGLDCEGLVLDGLGLGCLGLEGLCLRQVPLICRWYSARIHVTLALFNAKCR